MRGRVTSVVEEVLGSEIAEPVAAGAVSIVVDDFDSFDWQGGSLVLIDADDESTEFFNYTLNDEDNPTALLLDDVTTKAYDVGDFARLDPESRERVANVIGNDQEEPLEARVPHSLYALLDVGLREHEVEQEVVDVGQIDNDLVIDDVIGVSPEYDGTYFDPDTLPPAPPPDLTDGLAPTSSPTPIWEPAIRAIGLSWDPVPNADLVTYDVHISLTTGFATDDATTKSGETKGTRMTIYELPDETALDYGTPDDGGVGSVPYYVKIVARDADGSAAPGAEATCFPVQATGPDIQANSILAGHLGVNSVEADKLAATLALLSTLIAGPDPPSVKLGDLGGDDFGFRQIDSEGNTVVEMVGDVSHFTGVIEAAAITILDQLLMQGTSNRLDGASVLTVSSKAVSDPVSAPTVEIDNETLTLTAGAGTFTADPVIERGLHYDASGSGASPSFWAVHGEPGDFWLEEFLASSGVTKWRTRPTTFGWPATTHALGCVRLGSYVYVLMRRKASGQDAEARIYKFEQATLNLVGFTDVTNLILQNSLTHSCLGTDGTNLILATMTGGSAVEYPMLRFAVGDNFAVITDVTLTGAQFDGSSDGDSFLDLVITGGKYWLAHNSDGVFGANSWDVTTKAMDGNTGFVSGPQGLAHDGTRFWSRGMGGPAYQMTKHTNWSWISSNDYIQWAYVWRDDAGDYRSMTSPRAVFNVKPAGEDAPGYRKYRRSRFKITVPSFPNLVTKARLYMVHAPSSVAQADSQLRRQAAPTYISTESARPTYQTDENAAGATAATEAPSNNWPGGNASIVSEGGALPARFSGDGKLRVANFATASRPAGPTKGDIIYDTDLDALLVWNGSRWRYIGAKDYTVVGTTGGPTSGSAADPMTAVIPEMSITADFEGDPILILLTCAGSLSGGAGVNSGHIALYDGATEIGNSRRFLQSIGAGVSWHWMTHARYTPAAGSRTITARWRCGGGTLSANSTNREMTIIRRGLGG